MTQGDLLERIVGFLDRAALPYMVTGSIASSYYGAPRSTQDVDFVVDADASALERFLDLLPVQDYYLSRDAAHEALLRESMFNLIDFESGWKVGLVIRKSRPFSQMEFSRRLLQTILGRPLWLASPEDVILAKLEWNKISPSDRQLTDVARMIEVQGDGLDREYIVRWAEALGLLESWRRLDLGNEKH